MRKRRVRLNVMLVQTGFASRRLRRNGAAVRRRKGRGVRCATQHSSLLGSESVMKVTGKCLCGAVRWESAEPPMTTRVCWCRDCQYLGAGSGTVGACFRSATFRVVGQLSDFARVANSGNRKQL